MSLDHELQKHYALLLGIGSPWEVKTVELKLQEKKVEIELSWQWGAAAKCPECGRACSIHDCAPERTWRHLDTMQFTTLIRARTPRSNCPVHGVKTMQVPWAAPQGRFTLLFERFAVEVLLASAVVDRTFPPALRALGGGTPLPTQFNLHLFFLKFQLHGFDFPGAANAQKLRVMFL